MELRSKPQSDILNSNSKSKQESKTDSFHTENSKIEKSKAKPTPSKSAKKSQAEPIIKEDKNSIDVALAVTKSDIPKTTSKNPSVASSSQSKTLAGRKDVVYKTLLRAVKRYYTAEFEAKTEYNSLTKSKQEKMCVAITNKFVKSTFPEFLQMSNPKADEPSDTDTVNGVNFKEVSLFMLALIIPSYIKRHYKQTPTFEMYDTFYE